jgi:hypothetical protein
MNKIFGLALAPLLLTTAQPVLAHGNMKPQHGGVVQMAGETLFELVRGPAGVSLYVSDDDEPVAAAGATARLAVTVGGKTQNVPLKSAAGNRFDAPGLKLAPGTKVAVLVIDKTTQARMGTTFVIK